MQQETFEILFSKSRIRKYRERVFYDNELAVELYLKNIELSQSFYPLLALIEVILRNRIDLQLSKKYNSSEWFEKFAEEHPDFKQEIMIAKNKILSRNEKLNKDKIVAELSFGFWSALFNSKYSATLWKSLRLSFPNLEKKNRQLRKVSSPINHIRKFRNRIFHYEPIVWNLKYVREINNISKNLLLWLADDIDIFLSQLVKTETKIIQIETFYSKNNL